MGTPTEGFACTIYIQRRQPDQEWIREICHTLWRYGVQFLNPNILVGTWEEQLQATIPSSIYARKSLSDQIDEIVTRGYGELICYDQQVDFELSIDTNLRYVTGMAFNQASAEEHRIIEQSSFGKMELYVRRPIIDIDHRLVELPPSEVLVEAYLIPPYQQIHMAMLHWLDMLNQKLQPAFAVGYYSINSYFAEESDFLYKFDLAMISTLEQQQVPPLQDWLNSIYILYTPADLKTSPQTEAWLSSLKMWKQQLPDGSTIAYTMPETPDEIRIKDLNAAAQKLLDQRDRSQLPLARIYLQRAQEISAVAHIPQEYFGTTRRLEQIAYMEEHPEIFFE